jgi:hypothetical protein
MSDNTLFEKLGRWIWRLLLVYLGLLVLESVACAAVIVALSGPADADLTDAQRTVASSSLITMGYADYAQVAVFLVIAILFLRMLYKAAQRAKGFAVPFTYVSPAWAVGYWFVPIFNLYRPFQVVKALFAACTQEAGPTVKPAAGEQLLSAWWTMFIIGNLANWVLSRSDTDFNSRTGIIGFAEYSIVCNLLVIAATVLFSRVVKRLVAGLGVASAAHTLPGGTA